MIIRVESHGTIVLLRPIDDEAQAWLDESLASDAQFLGNAVAVEPRYVLPILQGFQADGGTLTR